MKRLLLKHLVWTMPRVISRVTKAEKITSNLCKIVFAVALLLPTVSRAQEMAHTHGGQSFHAFTLEADFGGSRNGPVSSWDLNGWIGGNTNKLWLKSEGEYVDGAYEGAEFWAMYSRNIATFWDFQAGIRHDTRPRSTSYAVLGFAGLAPYFIETEAHLFLSDDGDVSARLRGETDFLFTQQLILQPYMEGNLYAQDVANQEIGAGIWRGCGCRHTYPCGG